MDSPEGEPAQGTQSFDLGSPDTRGQIPGYEGTNPWIRGDKSLETGPRGLEARGESLETGPRGLEQDLGVWKQDLGVWHRT